MADLSRTKAYRELRTSLEDHLAARGLIEPIYADLLGRYMELWCEWRDLGDDIRERGVVVMDEKRGMMVENRSLTIRHQTSQKMLDIYSALGFRDLACGRTPSLDPDEDDEL